jgi:hypothetical protein
MLLKVTRDVKIDKSKYSNTILCLIAFVLCFICCFDMLQ